MIRIDLKEKKYGNDVIIKDLKLEIKDGEFVIINGKSGSGKSTLINIISLLDNKYRGILEIDGKIINDISSAKQADFRRQNFGLIFQDYNLLEKLTVIENVVFSLNVVGYQGDKKQRAREILKMVGLEGHEHKKINQISGGQQQRIGIARSLAADPKYIIADEPTGNLDSETAFEILDLLKELNEQGRTIIMISHDKKVLKYASRLISISAGEIIENEEVSIYEGPVYHQEEKFQFSFGTIISQALKNFKRHIWKYVVIMIITIACSFIFAVTQSKVDSNISEMQNYNIAKDQLVYNINGREVDGVPRPLNEKDLEQLKKFEGISKTTVNYRFPTVTTVGDKNVLVDMASVENYYEQEFVELMEINENSLKKEIYLKAGNLPSKPNEIVVNEAFIKFHVDSTYDNKTSDPSKYVGTQVNVTLGNLKADKKVTTDQANYNSKQYTFTISGIDNSSSKENRAIIYLTNDQLAMINKDLNIVSNNNLLDNNFNEVSITTLATEKEKTEKFLKDNHFTFEKLDVPNYDELIAKAKQKAMYMMLFGVIICSIILGIINLKTFNQREKELGIYYSLGLSKFRITTMMFFEMIFTTICSAILSVIAINAFIYYIYDVKEIILKPTIIYAPENFPLLIGFIIAISLLSLLTVLFKILRQDPIKILKKI